MAPNIWSPIRKSHLHASAWGQLSWLGSSLTPWLWPWFGNARLGTKEQVCSKSADPTPFPWPAAWPPRFWILKDSPFFMLLPLSYSNMPSYLAMSHCGTTPQKLLLPHQCWARSVTLFPKAFLHHLPSSQVSSHRPTVEKEVWQFFALATCSSEKQMPLSLVGKSGPQSHSLYWSHCPQYKDVA